VSGCGRTCPGGQTLAREKESKRVNNGGARLGARLGREARHELLDDMGLYGCLLALRAAR